VRGGGSGSGGGGGGGGSGAVRSRVPAIREKSSEVRGQVAVSARSTERPRAPASRAERRGDGAAARAT